MSDFKRDLRQYIDGLEEPVSVQETMNRRQERRFRVPAAVLAGAAVVLLPALVLLGLRMLPADGEDVAETTTPPAPATTTTIAVAPTTADTPIPTVIVPDLVGLSEQQARQALLDLGLDLTVAESRNHATLIGVSAQVPEPGIAVAVGSEVIVDVYAPAGCAVRVIEIPEGSTSVSLQRQCPPGEYPAQWQAVSHVVPAGSDSATATMQLLVAGPDDWETEHGYASMFSESSRNAIEAVTVNGNHMIVDFNDAILVNNASTSTGSMFFLAELQANVFQFADIASVDFQLNGSCDAFWNWLQRDCTTMTRAEWEAQLASWNEGLPADNVGGIDLGSLPPASVTASSTLSEAFPAANLIDGDLETAWQAPFSDVLILEFRWADPVQIEYVEIFNLSDEEPFLRNYRIDGYKITVDDLPGVELRNSLMDQVGGPQRIAIASMATQVLTLEVLSNYAGTAVDGNAPFSELVVAEFRFSGSPAP